jgi:hypothetical protein
MALNVPDICEDEIDDIVTFRIDELLAGLIKMGYKISRDDIEYELLCRCEYISIPSEKIYPGENLPGKFGCGRGYNGGGMHGHLGVTEITGMTKSRQAKATRALELFKKTFWGILEDIDKGSEATTGQSLQPWEKITI